MRRATVSLPTPPAPGLGHCVLPRGQRAVGGRAVVHRLRHGSSGHKGSEVPDGKGLHPGLSQLTREGAGGKGRGPGPGVEHRAPGRQEGAPLSGSCP